MTMRRRMKEDNRGIALISVMICVMLSFLLSATIMRVSLLSYLQKGIAKQATTTFYENETFVDDIKLGVQQKVAMAFANSSSTSQASFLTNFKTALLAAGTGGTEKAQLESALASFISNTEALKVVSVTVDGEGGVLFKPEGEGEYVIKNVKIEYIDNTKDGYVSNIKTDIRIKSPFYISLPDPSVGGYSMFAGGGFTIPANGAKPATLNIQGNVYVGYDDTSSKSYKSVNGVNTLTNAKAMEWTKHCAIYWSEGSTITINGDVYVSGYSNLVILSSNVDVRGKIYVSNTSHIIISSNTTMKCQDIVVDCPESSSNGGWKISSTSGKSIKGNYSYGASETVTYLPKSGESTSDSYTWGDRTGNKAGLYVWNGSSASHVTSSPGSSVSGVSGLTFDSENYPHPRVKYTYNGHDYWFDEQYLQIVDVEYFLPFATSSEWPPKNPQKQMTTAQYTVSGDKWLAKSGVDINSLATGNASEWQNYQYGNASNEKVNVMVNLGKVATVNTGYHFVIGFGAPIVLNDMNTTQSGIGVYISPDQIQCTAREGNSRISGLADLAENVSYAKTFFDQLGRQVMYVNNVNLKYLTVNNFFKGGIKIFYEGSSGGGTGTTVTHDEVKNKSLEVVTFENWEKY